MSSTSDLVAALRRADIAEAKLARIRKVCADALDADYDATGDVMLILLEAQP